MRRSPRSIRARLREHFRLRPGRALRGPAGFRPDRAGHGRSDVDHGPAGAGAGARRHSDRRSQCRDCLRRSGSSWRSSSVKNPNAASGSPPPCFRRRSSCSISRPRAGLMQGEVPKQAGNNHPTSIPTGVYKTTTATSTSPSPARRSGSASARPSGAGMGEECRITQRRRALEES